MSDHVPNLRRVAALSIALAVISASVAAAQTAPSTRAAGGPAQPALGSTEFERLITGKHLVVTTADGSQREGVFTAAPTGLAGAEPGSVILVPYGQIVRVEKTSTRVRKWTLIGLAAGAGVGFYMTNVSDESFGILALPLGASIGAGVGAGIGGIRNLRHRETDVIYDARRGTKMMSLAPIVSQTRKGIAFLMTWR